MHFGRVKLDLQTYNKKTNTKALATNLGCKTSQKHFFKNRKNRKNKILKHYKK